MVKLFVLALMAIVLLPHYAFCANAGNGEEKIHSRIRILFDNREVIVAIFANPAGEDFLSLFPLEAVFKDYAGVEKITGLPRKLNTSGTPTASVRKGDFSYYAPWGNLAVFYKGVGSDSRLYVLGSIESGKEYLSDKTHDFAATIERIE